MTGRRRRRFASFGMVAALLALIAAGVAAADPFRPWSGSKGPFAWEAHRVGCGVVGRNPSVIRAHTRWTDSPANGYVRLTFVRQIRDEGSGHWDNVQRQRRSTKNTSLEGSRAVIHWTQWFFPFADEAGALSRHHVVFDWFRDRPGADARAMRRKRAFKPCVVAPHD
jgi:hypothetical protein